MAKGYISNRQKNLKVGISSYTEDTTTLSVVGKVGIGTDNASADLDVRGDINVTNINAVDASFTGNVSIAGTLTYDDVTNIDAIGLVTARSGIDIGYPGTATTLTADGNAVFSGIVTAAQFFGDGSGLDGVTGVSIVAQEVTGDPVYPTFASNVGVTTLGIAQTGFVYVPSTGNVGIGSTQPASTLVVNAGAGYTGNLLDVQYDGASRIYISTEGYIANYCDVGVFDAKILFTLGPNGVPGGSNASFGYRFGGGAYTTFERGGTKIYNFSINGIAIGANKYLGWTPDNNASGGPDVTLFRDGANALGLRRFSFQDAPNTFRVYNTYTSSTNFERGQVGWTTDVFIVGTEKGVDGGTARPMHFQTDGTTRVAITTDGYVGIGSTQPNATLVVSAPSGYSGDILNIQDTDYTYGTRFRVTAGVSSVYLVTDGLNPSTLSSQGYWFSSSRFGSGTQRHGMGTRYNSASAGIAFWALGNAIAGAANNGFFVDGNYGLGFAGGPVSYVNPDTFIIRDAANTLAQRNAGAGQTFRIYNTYTSASQYERAYLGWNNNTFEIGVGTAGISTARSISLVGAAGSNTGDTLQPLQINQTWTTGSGIATALTLNVTDTSSSSSSKLLDLRVDGSSKFSITKTGNPIVADTVYFGSTTGYNILSGPGFFGAAGGTTKTLLFRGAYGQTLVRSDGSFGWSDSSILDQYYGDTFLHRDTTGTVAIRSVKVASQPNALRIYNLATNTTDSFERAQVGWTTDVFIVGTEKGSSIGTARPMHFQTDGTTRVAITTDGYVGIGSTLPGSTLVVNAPSGYTGNVLDLQVGGTSKLKFNELGYGVNGNFRWGVQNTQGSTTDFLFFIKYLFHGYPSVAFGDISLVPTFSVDNRGMFGWANSNGIGGGGVKNLAEIGTRLYRDATGIIGQRNGTTPNTFRVYNTYTSATDFERANVGWTTDTFIVGTEKGSAGGEARQLELQTDGTTRVAITTDGYVGIGSTQPTATLDVVGDVNITGIVTATKFVGEVEIINPFLLMGA